MQQMNKLKKVKLSEMVASELKDYIIKNHLQPGDRLPTELELVEMLSVSRSSVREGIKMLQNLGIVESRNKKGLVIKETDFSMIQNYLEFHIMNHQLSHMTLREAIMMIHFGIVPLIIEKISDKEIQELEDIMAEWERDYLLSAESRQLDIHFHSILFEASGNEIIMQYTNVLKEYLFGEYEKHTPEKAKETLDLHIELLSSIKEKDLAKTIVVMCEHNHYPITTPIVQ